MEWSVVKIGIAQFDTLHAYGLGILLATACGEPVELRETAFCNILSCSIQRLPRMSCNELLERVFPLPGEGGLQAYDYRDLEQHLPVTVLDGLLAALFTTPGLRVLSVSDLLEKQRLDAKAIRRGLHKVANCLGRWRALTGKAAPGKEVDWLTSVLDDYDLEHPTHPILSVGKSVKDVNVLMMIDPAFAFSLRSARSDGRMTWKTQVTLRGTCNGALLAYIGAARFLRAQRLSGELVNCYVPIAKNITIRADTSLPLLYPTDKGPDRASLLRWLALSQEAWQPGIVWSGLAYQTLLTQGQQQSLSLESGVLDNGWLFSLQQHIGVGVINWWRALISQQGAHDEQELLLDCLKRREAHIWIKHLKREAQRTNMFSESNGRRYSLEEVRTITEAMHDVEHTPLQRILERERGTLCFGRALRQIGRYNPSRLRDLLEDLEEVQTRAQLYPVLQRIVLASEIEKAKERKIIVPTEADLAALLDDIDQYGIPELVGLLLVLSALRYPPSENALKYELSTLIRALIVLAVLNEHAHISEDDQSPLSRELFIDDPEVPDGSFGE
jgi:hypothetical protein